MDPDKSNPQVEDDSLKKLEEDLQNLSKETSTSTTTNSDFGREGLGDTSPSVEAVDSPQGVTGAPKKSIAPNLLMILIGGLILFYAVTQLSVMFGNSTSSNPTLAPTPTSTADATSNWKTYTNTQFSFKYPPELIYCSNYGGSTVQLWPAPFPCLDGVDVPSEISVISYKSGEYKSNKKISSSRKIDLGGIEVTENIIKYDETDGPWKSLGGATEILVPVKDGLIQILLHGEKPEQKIRLNQILTTFKLATLTSSTPSAKACTLEAKLCPNGTSVGRTGPNCEFAACPQ